MSSKWCLSPGNSPRALPHVPQPTQPAPCPQHCRRGQQDTRTQDSAGSSGADPCSSVPPHTAPEDATRLGTQPSWTSGNSSTPKRGAQSILGFCLAPIECGCLAPNPMGFTGQGGTELLSSFQCTPTGLERAELTSHGGLENAPHGSPLLWQDRDVLHPCAATLGQSLKLNLQSLQCSALVAQRDWHGP